MILVFNSFGIEERAQCFYVITQWAELGNLEDYLKNNDSSSFSWHEKYRIAHQVAHALFYCHEREVLHVDVRSPNILLDETMTAKLSNFEYSRKEDGVSVPARDQAIRIRYVFSTAYVGVVLKIVILIVLQVDCSRKAV